MDLKFCLDFYRFSFLTTRTFVFYFFFFLNDPAPPEIYPLSLPDSLPILLAVRERGASGRAHVSRTTPPPRRQLEFRVPGLVTAPATPIALIDADGALAPLAATTLGAM